MKIALYIEDGREQIVLTPETSTEKGILGKLHDGTRELNVYQGEFYGCQGGWTRWSQRTPDVMRAQFRPTDQADRSTIIVLDKKEATDGNAA